MANLEGKVVFITGAARGQGRSHAIMMAEQGADIIAVDLAPDGDSSGADAPAMLADTVREVQRHGRRIVARSADVSKLADLERAVADGVAELGRLDCVVANAGMGGIATPIFEIKEAQWSRLLAVNVQGAWATCKAASPHLGTGASIVLVGSTAALRPAPGYAAYSASKHALIGLMRTLVLEVAPRGIRVNAVHPGIVDTPMFHNPEMYRLLTGDESASREVVAERMRTQSPMGIPWVEPRDVSAAVIFLCSDDARYITGASLVIDAGAAAK
jgi:SDR family mycofactocin-dependent oxidoreductase